MDQVPSPLHIGSPATTRKPSIDSVPNALRAGSPATERGYVPWDSRPPLVRKNTSGSDRLSQLFPSRTSSISSISPPVSNTASRRTSYPSPLTPAAEPSYRIPRAPAPPTFAEDTSYRPSASPFEAHGSSPPIQSRSGTNRLLNRLATLRNAGRGGAYNKLEDEESRPGTRRLNKVDEDEESMGYDLGGRAGVRMKNLDPQKKPSTTPEALEQSRDLNEAGLAAEFERLEAQLGAGLSSVIEKPFTHSPATRDPGPFTGHDQTPPKAQDKTNQAESAQEEAEKTGDIVAVAGIPVDISDSFGADFDTRSILTTSTAFDKNESQTSYFFPTDPDMPSWRPLTMGWPWISMLICISLALAAVQEFLCQRSMRLVREDPDGGLAKFTKADDLSLTAFFTWKYAPIMIFVFYGILWQMSDFEVKRLEPYYQLSKKTGATAGESLNMDYLTFASWLVPLKALRHKQYAVIYSSLGTLIASSLVPILQSASINVYPPKSRRESEGAKSIRIDPPWSRAVSACLVLVAFCGGALMYAMRRRSGLEGNPAGIAGIAAMATKSHILTDFHGLDTAPLDKIHKQLRHRRYILHKSSLWQGEFIRNSTEKVHEHGSDPRPLMLRLTAGIPFIAYMVIFTITIPIFMFVEATGIITEKLPFLMTGLATAIKILWNTMNCDVRMLQPFYILAQRNASAKTLTLDYAGTNPLFLPFIALFNRHWLVALVAFGSILAEVLTVCVSSISVDGKRFIPGHGGDDDGIQDANDRHNTEQTFTSFWTSFVISMLILLYLIATAALTYSRRAHKFMPRQIGTMASVLAFIHQSKMLVRFVDTEKLDRRRMEKHLEKQGKTFALGWFVGRDGEDHLGIDEEPVMAGYEYGVDRANTRMLGHQIGTWEHFD